MPDVIIGTVDYANLYNRGQGVEGEIHVNADNGGRTIHLDPDSFGRFLVELSAHRKLGDFLGVAVRVTGSRIEVI